MATLVEVKVLDYTIVLACDENSTVADITAAAVAEVQTFNLRNFPRKVLHTRDTNGRILSGSLKLLQNNLQLKLVVVVAEYSNNDALNPIDTLSLYRDWQYWTTYQVQETIRGLSIQDIPPHPEETTLSLLYELCRIPVEKVQLMCSKTLQILLNKFSQRELVIAAAEQICKMFISTSYASVAVASLECFKGLSPLQAKVFNGAKYVKEMFNVQQTLSRFSEDKQSMLFEAFRSISVILGDKELDKAVGFVRPEAENAVVEPSLKALRFVETLMADAVDAPNGIVAATTSAQPEAQQVALPLLDASSLPPPVGVKRINLKRLESLLASEDARVRRYSLEKLLKLLTLSAKAHMEGDAAVAHNSGTVDASERSEWDSQDGALGSWDEDRSAGRPSTVAYKFSFSGGKEVDSLVKCLFRCLKQCINARPKQPSRHARSASEGDAEGTGDSPDGGVGGAGGRARQEATDSPGSRSKVPVTATSTAGRLIQTALGAAASDEAAVRLVVDCLWQVVHFPQDVARDTQFPLGLTLAAQKKFKMTGAPLSNIQVVFLSAAREWYRLLLTLAHADEGSNLLRYADLAEKCAYYYALVVLHGMPSGWKDAELSLEGAAICSFLSSARPTFRSYLGLTYLTFMSARCFPEEWGGAGSLGSAQAETGEVESQALQSILQYRNAEVSAAVWRWGTGTSGARRSALMSLTCLSSFCAFSSFAAFMFKLDPITRLAAMLQLAVRDEAAERQEYGVATASTLSDRLVPLKSDTVGPEDDWDASPDSVRIPVLAAADEEQEDPDDNNPEGPSLDAVFGARSAVSPRGDALLLVPATGRGGGNALDRLLQRKNSFALGGANFLSKEAQVYVYPDIPLIRLILKTMANLLSASRSSGVYSAEYRGEVGNWLRGVDVGARGDGAARVKLSRVVKVDEIAKFYYNSITQ